MNPWRSDGRRDLWLPVLVGLLGTLASLAAWGFMVADRREQILGAAHETADGTRESAEVALRRQVEALRDVRDLWRAIDAPSGDAPPTDLSEWIERAAGLTSLEVERMDVDGAAGAAREGLSREQAETLLAGAEVIVGPTDAPDGAVVYDVIVPLERPDGATGLLVARFDVASFLEEVLAARAHGYALIVGWQGREIYRRGVSSADRWQGWWKSEATVSLPLGGTWDFVLRPTPDFAALRLTPIPHYFLATGLVLSLVLAVLTHQIRLVVRQSRFLAATNRALEQRGVELESRVADRTRDLEEAVNELEAFNYSVSHDLRSPLGAILNFANILEDDYRGKALDADGEEILKRIRRSAERSIELLDGLLKLSRAGRAALRIDRVDMTNLARETFDQARAAEGGNENLELSIEPLPEARGDRDLLANVFANLFGNALKYSRGQEKRRITVSGRVEGGECVYEVSDNGSGFDMRFAGKLFGLFERLHSCDDIEGTGVGLAVVGRIIKRHGGRVWAEGRIGEGARFTFALPKAEVS